MTGFARTSGEAEWGRWVWEGKSVNGKGLDARINTPSGLEAVEKAVKNAVSARFFRGNFQIGLRIEMAETGAEIIVNQTALKALMDAYEQADGTMATGPALATLMGMKGVVETGTPALRTLSELPGAVDAIVNSGEEMLDQLLIARRAEGEKLAKLLLGHLSEVAEISAESVEFAAEQLESIRQSYRSRIAELDQENTVSEERLASEIAVLAAKADVNEELDRLNAHVGSGMDLLKSAEAVGRNLGFLAQELNREANTLCAKSASMDLTNAGLALKSVIDQFKEQAANVE